MDDPARYPWMAGLITSSETDLRRGHFCGGTLIAPQWVATAAHCLVDETPDAVDVVLGTVNLVSPNTGYERIPAAAFFIHPEYNQPVAENNDIALIQLARPSTRTVVNSLAAGDVDNPVGAWTTVIGWGNTLPQPRASNFPEQLQKVDLPIVSNQVCQASMTYDDSIITERMICAGFAQGGRDSCQGDSGGPLVKTLEGGGHMLVGVVSYGEGCAEPDSYGVYARVSEFGEWIREHIGTDTPWFAEIGLINPSASASMTGTLRGLDAEGEDIWVSDVNLSVHERQELDVAEAAGAAAPRIKSMRLDITGGQAVGYQKFYQTGKYRVGLEALPNANQENLYVPHIASNNDWWTGIGWTNTTNVAKSLQFTFDTGQQAEKQLGAGGHDAFTIASLFDNARQPEIGAAQVSGGAGMVGLMLFGGLNSNILSGVTLSDSTTSTLYFPHVAHNNEWWTGLVVYNPGDETANLTLTYFDAQGGNLGRSTTEAGPGQKMMGTPDTLSFPEGTAWFMVQASLPVTGFELFGTTDSNQLAGYSVVDLAASSGVFPKLERNGWTGIAFVNPGEAAIQVQAQARNDEGTPLATSTVDLDPGQKWVAQATALFSGQDISAATYISFTADDDVVGFQLNGSSDGTMLDAIPALGGTHTGTQSLYFPHIAVGN